MQFCSSLRGVKNGYEEGGTEACSGNQTAGWSGTTSGEGCEEGRVGQGSGKGSREDDDQDSRSGSGTA
jgi:hypothetical protein